MYKRIVLRGYIKRNVETKKDHFKSSAVKKQWNNFKQDVYLFEFKI